MGCDIHIVIQVQEPSGAWVEVAWQMLWSFQRREGLAPLPGVPLAPECFADRNYNLFGILADVRNGRGFVGVDTGDAWPSIAAERGFPDGFDPARVLPEPEPDPAYQDAPGSQEPRNMGDHSHTWIGLAELEAFDWDGTVREQRGYVSEVEYEILRGSNERPKSYCGWAGGVGVRCYTPAEYEAAKESETLVLEPYIQYAWKLSARAATGDWPGKCLPWLRELAAGRPLRLVIGFDS